MTKFKKPFFLLLVLYLVILSVNLIVNYPIYSTGGKWMFSVLFSLAMTTVGWIGYTLLYHRFFKVRLNWNRHPSLNLFLTVVLSGVYGIVLMVIAMLLLQLSGRAVFSSIYSYALNGMYAALFTMLLGLLINGQHFLQQWKKSTEDNERMKTELIKSQYEVLKGQVNPHFLFNAMNTLVTLIPTQADVSVQFVHGLSHVLRYSLQHDQEVTVVLATELKVVTAFLFLNQQRFGSRLKVVLEIDPGALQFHIVTHSLLMLVENALKHNEISADKPLFISVSNRDHQLSVSNNYQPRNLFHLSLGIGLSNIVDRYKLITDRPVTIQTNDFFTVNIPLLAL